MKRTKSLALSLALLAGCVAPKEKIEEPPVYGPFREDAQEIIDMLGVSAREVSDEELDNCRAPMFPPKGYQNPQLRMMYWSILRNRSSISRVRNYGR